MNTIKCPKCHEEFQIDEAGYAAIVKQVRDNEFSKDLNNIETQLKTEKENAVQLAKMEVEKDYTEKLNKKDEEIAKLKAEITTEQITKKSAIKETEAEKDKQIAELQNKLDSYGKDKEIEINKIKNEMQLELEQKKNEIVKL